LTIKEILHDQICCKIQEIVAYN